MQDNTAENTELETPEVEQDVQQETEAEEYEISLGDSPSQDSPKGNNPVVRRLVGQREKLREQNADQADRIAQLEAELKVRQTMEPTTAPKYEDFDTDEDYQSAVQKWALSTTKPAVDPTSMFSEFQAQQARRSRIDNHYAKAEELAQRFPDYSQAEEAAVQTLGANVVEEIAALSDRSPEIMLYFGRNPNAAEKFKHLLATDNRKATMELGRLESQLNIQPRIKTPPPEPDEPLEGGGHSPLHSYQMKLKKARDTGNVREAIEIRKQAESEGLRL